MVDTVRHTPRHKKDDEDKNPRTSELTVDMTVRNPEDYRYKESWYLNPKFMMVMAFVLSLMPLAGFLLIPLIYLKNKRFSAHCAVMAHYAEKEYGNLKSVGQKVIDDVKNISENILNEANEKAKDITNVSNDEANKIVGDAKIEAKNIVDNANSTRSRLLSESRGKIKNLNDEIEKRQLTAEKIIQDATNQAAKMEQDALKKLERINSEISKKDSYLAEVEEIKQRISALTKKFDSQKEKVDLLMRLRKTVNSAIQNYFKDYENVTEYTIKLPPSVINEIDSLVPSVILNLHSMDYKDLRRAFRENNKLIEETLKRYEGRYTTKTNKAIYKLMVIALQAELQNILYTLTYSKLNDAIDAVRKVTAKYLNIAREGNQTISSTIAKFVSELEILFIDAVKIEYEYYVKREAAKQEQLELRAKMREEAEEQKRLKEQQEQMEKEESKYNAEIENITEQLKNSEDDEKNKILLEKIKMLESQLQELSEKKDEIINLQNGKAGYVYIISNLGSFGDDVFKIGMTRRLNPQERIDELGSASVPFKFDVHSFIFSEDAVQLESNLHSALNSKRLNKVNTRKEFFKIPIDELEKLVEEVDPAAEFNRTMQAEQYYQSLSILEEKYTA